MIPPKRNALDWVKFDLRHLYEKLYICNIFLTNATHGKGVLPEPVLEFLVQTMTLWILIKDE